MCDCVLAKFLRVLIQHMVVSHAKARGKSHILIIHFAFSLSSVVSTHSDVIVFLTTKIKLQIILNFQ